jgi:hypothetical protein
MTCIPCCPICFNSYQPLPSNCVPQIISCGHTYCSSCLQHLIQQNPKSSTFSCSICRRNQRKPREFQSFPLNYALLDCVYPQENHVNYHGLQKCRDHPGESQKYYDRDCHRLVCSDCIAIGGHSGHRCQRIQEFQQSYSPPIVTIISADQQTFHLPLSIASLSETIHEHIAGECPSSSFSLCPFDHPFPGDSLLNGFFLAEINGDVMAQIIQFLFHLHEEPLVEIHKVDHSLFFSSFSLISS